MSRVGDFMFRRWGLLLLAAVSLSSCGLFKKNNSWVAFDSSVSDNQKDLLQGDLQLVSSLNFVNVTYEDLDTIDLPELSGNSLAAFLHNRVKFIVGEGFDASSQRNVVSNYYNYSPSLMNELSSPFDRVVTVMTNTGSAVYLDGKDSNVLYSIRVADQSLLVNTPRVGIIKIGEGLFSNSRVNNISPDSLGRRLLRLGTLFHESRHSDGNGSNAGFPHTKCTSGDFAGYYACESNTNGPYNVEAMILRHFYEVCNNCSESELSALQISAADAASRLVYGAVKRDPQPEFVR